MSNQFGVPVALERIAWRTYIVFCVWCTVQATIIYFMMPETKNRTVSHTPPFSFSSSTETPTNPLSQLEELDEIFESKNPVKKSIEKKKLAIDANNNVLNVEDA